MAAACAVAPALAQDQQYPPPPQYPSGQQYPPPAQYPQQQGQYPPPQQYPAPQQYPSGQYPAPPPNAPPPMLAPQQLDSLVSVIALYPDPLLAQVLTASTFPDQIPESAGWAAEHQYLQGPELAAAIQQDQLPWDPSVVALLPFPSVLQYMASNMGWTQQLGDAVLAQRGQVMDAVQRMRQTAYEYGYLRSNPYYAVQVAGPEDIQIVPMNPGYIYVPYYNPAVVFARPRPGFYAGGVIRFGPRIGLGAAFAPWGWGRVDLGWRAHNIIIEGHPWERTWVNRRVYVNRYYAGAPHYRGPVVERNDIRAHERARQEQREREHDRGHDRGDHGHH